MKTIPPIPPFSSFSFFSPLAIMAKDAKDSEKIIIDNTKKNLCFIYLFLLFVFCSHRAINGTLSSPYEQLKLSEQNFKNLFLRIFQVSIVDKGSHRLTLKNVI